MFLEPIVLVLRPCRLSCCVETAFNQMSCSVLVFKLSCASSSGFLCHTVCCAPVWTSHSEKSGLTESSKILLFLSVHVHNNIYEQLYPDYNNSLVAARFSRFIIIRVTHSSYFVCNGNLSLNGVVKKCLIIKSKVMKFVSVNAIQWIVKGNGNTCTSCWFGEL